MNCLECGKKTKETGPNKPQLAYCSKDCFERAMKRVEK